MPKSRLYLREFDSIGYIRKSHGFKGHLSLEIEDLYLPDLEASRFVFLEIDGYKVPFEIESLAEKKGLLLKLKNINSPEELTKFPKRDLFLLREELKHAEEQSLEQDGLAGLAGMTIYDESSQKTGRIDRIEEYPQQMMAIVIIDDQEFLIPLVEDFIVQIDEDNDTLIMNLPEGLL